MKVFSAFTTYAIVALTLAKSALAAEVYIDQPTCSSVAWTINMTPADWAETYYVKLDVFDDTAGDGFIGDAVYVSSSGEIPQSGVTYPFVTNFGSAVKPSGSVWHIYVARYDNNANLLNGGTLPVDYYNPCSGSIYTTSSYTPIPTTTTSTIRPTSSTSTTGWPLPTTNTPDPIANKTKTNIAAIAGGVAGGVAFLLAAILFFFLRKRKAAKHAQEEQYGRDASMGEKGYPTGPMSAVSVLPHSQSYGTAGSGQEDVSRDGYYQSNVPPAPSTTTFSSPPTSPRMSAATRPMSNFSQSNFSASPAPARGNNPLLNRQQVSNSGWTASGPLAEPM